MNKLTKAQAKQLVWIVLTVIAFALATILGINYPTPIMPVLPLPDDKIVALGESHFTNVEVLFFSDWQEQTAISATASCVITPCGTYQPLESAGNVTCTLAITNTCATDTHLYGDPRYTEGDILWFENTANTTIIISETEYARLSGQTSLAQYDTLFLFFDGDAWIELAQADN